MIKYDFIKYINIFNENCKDNNSNLQWEHCYKVFYESRNNSKPDIDYLSLHLAFYLASWGMYRGSSFLRDYDYRVHIPVVREILSKTWNDLLAINVDGYTEKNEELLVNLYTEIYTEYANIRKESLIKKKKDDVKSPVSPILITKVLLGTLACVPAYDRYFERGLKDYGLKPKSIQRESLKAILNSLKKSLKALSSFYKINESELEKARDDLHIKDSKIQYPQMKLLDMGFWQIGRDIEDNNKD